jgi:hypothetical protein
MQQATSIDKRAEYQERTRAFWEAERKLLDDAFADIQHKRRVAEAWFERELAKLVKVRQSVI